MINYEEKQGTFMIIRLMDGICINQVMSSNNPLLLSNYKNYILIDTGSKAKCGVIIERLKNVLNGNHLSALIITHAHHDHVENVAVIKEKFNPQIIIQKG